MRVGMKFTEEALHTLPKLWRVAVFGEGESWKVGVYVPSDRAITAEDVAALRGTDRERPSSTGRCHRGS